jgi:hypothetical protein
MADNTILNPGSGGDTIAADDVAGVKYQVVKLDVGGDGASSGVTADNPLPVADANSGSILWRILQVLMSPLGYDKSLQRYRQTAVIETGNLGTISTVTTVTTVTALTNITGNIGNYQANQQVFGQNQASWAALVRARIT